jgi:hypothetical protein
MTLEKTMGSTLCGLVGIVMAVYGFSPILFSSFAGDGTRPPLMAESYELMVAVTHWEWIWASIGCFVIAILIRMDWGGKKKDRLAIMGQQPSLTAVIHADPNGKYYTRYRLITEGPNKGMYESIPTFFTSRTFTRDTVAEAELRDIYESGFAVHAPDPKSSK